MDQGESKTKIKGKGKPGKAKRTISMAGAKPVTTSKKGEPKGKKSRLSKGKYEEAYAQRLVQLETGNNGAVSVLEKFLEEDFAKLSAIEKQDFQLSASYFSQPPGFKAFSQAGQLKEFLKQALSMKDDILSCPSSAPKGCPRVIIVCGAATRATKLVAEIRPMLSEDVKVAKCFAKHMKIQQQKQFLESQQIGIAVGTPRRILDLIKEGAMLIEGPQHVILDSTWKDVRQLTMLELDEVKTPVLELIKHLVSTATRLTEYPKFALF